MRRCDQLLGARTAGLALFGPRGPGHLEALDRAAAGRLDQARAVHQAPTPRHVRGSVCHYAITSTLLSAFVIPPSRSRTSWSARIETSIWSSDGLRVVSRCSQRPGRQQCHHVRVLLMLAGESDQLVGEAGDHRQHEDAARDQPVPGGLSEEREDEDRDHHHPEQERRAAAGVDEAETVDALGRQLLPGLVRVDRLVLGRVVLEEPPEVGQKRDQHEIRDEDADADQALDDDEELGRLDVQPTGDQRRADLEQREREADGDRERKDDLAARELEILLALVSLRRVVRARSRVRGSRWRATRRARSRRGSRAAGRSGASPSAT